MTSRMLDAYVKQLSKELEIPIHPAMTCKDIQLANTEKMKTMCEHKLIKYVELYKEQLEINDELEKQNALLTELYELEKQNTELKKEIEERNHYCE